VFFRHGEKPSGGYGQLTCQGLNRALALPAVLLAKFGRPSYLYAPNPAVKISDPAGSFYYVRPLATIEPTAIRVGLSVNANHGYNDVQGLQNILIRSSKADSTIFVAWEHAQLVKVVQDIMNAYGGGAAVPAWTSGDYDSLYIVSGRLQRRDDQRAIRARSRNVERAVDGLSGLVFLPADQPPLKATAVRRSVGEGGSRKPREEESASPRSCGFRLQAEDHRPFKTTASDDSATNSTTGPASLPQQKLEAGRWKREAGSGKLD
jgi:hypothetical protein